MATLWSALHEAWIRDRMHAYRMYLHAARCTVQAARQEDNLRHAARVRENLRGLLACASMPVATREVIEAELARLDEERARLCSDMLLEALSQMYRAQRKHGC